MHFFKKMAYFIYLLTYVSGVHWCLLIVPARPAPPWSFVFLLRGSNAGSKGHGGRSAEVPLSTECTDDGLLPWRRASWSPVARWLLDREPACVRSAQVSWRRVLRKCFVNIWKYAK